MKRTNALVYILLGVMVGLFGCTETQTQEPVAKKEEKPPEPVDGQKAFFQMYIAARVWSQDAQGLRLESLHIPEVKRKGGAFGAWRATFVSLSKRRTAVFNYSVVEVGSKLQKGVFQDHEEGYSASRDKPWPVSALKVGSGKALEVALKQKHAKEYVKKNPDKPMMFILEHTNRHPDLTWRVVWGERVSTSDFSVYVDATTGEFLEVMR